MAAIPTFDTADVALLISSIEQSLERLYGANADVGGNDPQLLEYGRRYAVLLQKLKSLGHGASERP